MGPQTRQSFLPSQRKRFSNVRGPCKSATPSCTRNSSGFTGRIRWAGLQVPSRDNHHCAGFGADPPAPEVGVIVSRHESPNRPAVRLRRTQSPAEPKERTNELQLSELRLHTG